MNRKKKRPFYYDESRCLVLFQDHLEINNYSKATIKSYFQDIRLCCSLLNRPSYRIQRVKMEDISLIKRTLRERKMNPVSINRLLSSLRSFIAFVRADDLETGLINPRDITSVRTPSRMPKYSDQNDARVNEIIGMCHRDPDYEEDDRQKRSLMLDLMRYCGLRVSEVVSLMRDDFDFYQGRLLVHGKGNKERMMPLPRVLYLKIQNMIEKRTDDCLFLFVETNNNVTPHGYSTRYVQKIVQKYSEKLGYKNITPHTFRHAFATTFASSKDAKPEILQKLLGHNSMGTTFRYVHASEAAIVSDYQHYIKVFVKQLDDRENEVV